MILIRNNRDIRGIVIDGIEYKFSQYADDTSLIFDGSPESMDGILRVLDYFADLSGLKINYIKTKMVWIRSKKFSRDVFHHTRWKLNWNNSTFDLLGIKFSVTLTLDEIYSLNYEPKLSEIKSISNQWKLRKLTPIGKISVIKTLILPKLNQVVLTLPNPDSYFTKTLKREIYQFLWGSQIHKVKRNTIIEEYRYGGLKMIDFTEFSSALKSCWIRRMIFTDTKWINLLEAELQTKIKNKWVKGTDFISNICKNTNNIF